MENCWRKSPAENGWARRTAAAPWSAGFRRKEYCHSRRKRWEKWGWKLEKKTAGRGWGFGRTSSRSSRIVQVPHRGGTTHPFDTANKKNLHLRKKQSAGSRDVTATKRACSEQTAYPQDTASRFKQHYICQRRREGETCRDTNGIPSTAPRNPSVFKEQICSLVVEPGSVRIDSRKNQRTPTRARSIRIGVCQGTAATFFRPIELAGGATCTEWG